MNEMTIRGAEKMANLWVWSQRVAKCRGSGLPVSRWCQENGINVKTYYNWQKKVFKAMVEERREANTIPGCTVAENIFMGRFNEFTKFGLLDRKRVNQETQKMQGNRLRNKSKDSFS